MSISPNMNLVIPVVGTTIGPQWATDINSSLTIIDQHDHSSGAGVQVTVAGLDINADLSIGSNNLTNIRSSRYTAQVSPLALGTDLGCTYVSGVDLYFNDVNGNQIRITEAGGVAGTPGSISNLVSPASASYVAVSSTFVWQSNTNVAANLDARSILLRNSTALSNALTLNPPAAMAANFSLTLPSQPVSLSVVTLDNTGAFGTPTVFPLPAGGLASDSVTTAKILNGNVTRPKLEALGQQISSSSGTFTTNSTSLVDVTNLSRTITTTGRPVYIGLITEGAGSSGVSQGIIGTNGTTQAEFAIIEGSTQIAGYTTAAGSSNLQIPASSINFIHPIAAGTYTFKIQAANSTGGANLTLVTRVKLIVYEL